MYMCECVCDSKFTSYVNASVIQTEKHRISFIEQAKSPKSVCFKYSYWLFAFHY